MRRVNSYAQLVLLGLGAFWPLCAMGQKTECERLADRIEATWQRYEKVEYEVAEKTVRNSLALLAGEPLLVDSSSQYIYRSDGERWYAHEDGYSLRLGTTERMPRQSAGGFDGKVHYSRSRGRLTIGEESGHEGRFDPRKVFWQGGLSSSWLLTALRRPEATVTEEVDLANTKCIHIQSAWTPDWDTQERSFDILISPQQSFLPRRVRIERGGSLDAEWDMKKVAQTDSGLWYPLEIQVLRTVGDTTPLRELTVKRFNDRPDFTDADFDLSDPLPAGVDVVDHRRGIAWHNDPWFEELEPWMKVTLDWPRPDLRGLQDLRSRCDAELAGHEAPPLTVSKWIVGDQPASWDRPERTVTVLHFFGGRAIDPTPRQLSALGTLFNNYRHSGLSVIGIATASDTPERTIQAVKQLAVPFPVALDAKVPDDSPEAKEPGANWGSTFAAFGQSVYTGTLIIDRKGNVQLVEPDKDGEPNGMSALETIVRRELIAADRSAKDSLPVARGGRIQRKELESIQKEWIQLAATRSPASSIEGQVTAAPLGADKDHVIGQKAVIALIKASPELRLLSSNTPGGWTSLRDRSRTRTIRTNEEGEFSLNALHKGTWKLVVTAPGMASVQQVVHLWDDNERVETLIQMTLPDAIRGVVQDETGKPIAGASVQAIKRHLNPEVPRSYTTEHLPREKMTTDSQGRFAFEQMFVGSYSFRISAKGYFHTEAAMIPAGTQDVVVTLKKR